MAFGPKTPSAHVPSTSGQGVSRKAEQTSRNLGFKGTGSPGGKSFSSKSQPASASRSGVSFNPREYAKSEPAFNVDYGDTMQPPEMKGMLPEGFKPEKSQ